MKIAFYSNSNQLGIIPLRLKIFQSFKETFGKKIDYFTSDGGFQNIRSTEVNQYFKNTVRWGTPSPADYDVLIIPFLQSKGYRNYNQVAQNFKNYKKKVIQMQCTNCFDVTALSEKLIDQYIVASETYRKNLFNNHDKTNKITISSFLDNFVFIEDLDFLSKDDFYKKYNISKENKLVGLFPTRVDRIRDMSLHDGCVYKFYENLNDINKLCKHENVEILMKPHRWEIYGNKVSPERLKRFGFKVKNPHDIFLSDIKKVEPIDYLSLIKHSKANIVMMSTLIFSMYLTKKKAHYVGPIWTHDRTFKIDNFKKEKYESMINGYHFNKNNSNMIIEKISDIIVQSVNKKQDYHFEYQASHPIFGDILNLSLENYLYNLNKTLENL